MLELAKRRGVARVAVHAFLDGRDTPPRSAEASLQSLQALCAKLGNAHIATVSGRYYAMDRDQRWDRLRLAWDAIVEAQERTPCLRRFVRAARCLCAWRERRVRAAHGDRWRPADAGRRCGGVHELPRRPRAPAHRRFRFAGLRRLRRSRRWRAPAEAVALRLPDRIRRQAAGRGRLRPGRPAPHPWRVACRGGPDPAAHRRDGKIRARDLLLQRRARSAFRRRGTHPGAQSPRSPPTTCSRQ